MQTINFNGGTELPILSANATQIYVQGANRSGIEIQIAKNAIPIDALDKLSADSAKTGKLTIVDGDVTYVRDNYTIRAELALKPVVTAMATSTTPEQTEDRLCLTLAQLTYSEVQLVAQQAQIDALTLAQLGVK
jgi:hypothetical protein